MGQVQLRGRARPSLHQALGTAPALGFRAAQVPLRQTLKQGSKGQWGVWELTTRARRETVGDGGGQEGLSWSKVTVGTGAWPRGLCMDSPRGLGCWGLSHQGRLRGCAQVHWLPWPAAPGQGSVGATHSPRQRDRVWQTGVSLLHEGEKDQGTSEQRPRAPCSSSKSTRWPAILWGPSGLLPSPARCQKHRPLPVSGLLQTLSMGTGSPRVGPLS